MPSSDAFWTAIKPLLERALPPFLLQQRWYPAKDAGEPTVRAREFFSIPGHSQAAIAIWEVAPLRGNPLLMFVPVAAVQNANPDQTIAAVEWSGAGHSMVEAFSNDDFVRTWLGCQFAAESVLPALHCGRTGLPVQLDPASAEIRRSRAEQSNTSMRIGEHAIIKVIRKLESGPHPELEIARFLANTGFTATPALLGWVELQAQAGGDNYALSLLQQFVPNRGDGWSWTLQQLERGIGSGDQTALDELNRWLDRLAMQTAALHRAFAAGTDDPAFRSEPVTAEDLVRWMQSAEEMGQRALQAIEDSSSSSRQVQKLAAELIRHREDLLSRIRAFRNQPRNFLKTRHHGDFHLGQVLVAGNDVMILDFEGEPLRPLAQRRAKHCVLRDVAGALRSLSYAAAAAARSMPAATREQLTALRQWQCQAARAFMDRYFSAAHGLPSIPSARSEAEALLNFFLLEKALYEVHYEAANRPDWIDIPLQGTTALLQQERQ